MVNETGRGSSISHGVDELPRVSLTFEEFFEFEHVRLFGAMHILTGDRQEAEDLTQEAFLRMWERWHIVAGLTNPTGYLYRTALNAFRMRRRRAAVAARNLLRRVLRTDPIESAEARHDIDRALAALTPRQRAAVVLIELLEFSSAEAAVALGVGPAAVRKLASDGRRALRRTMGGIGE